MKIAIVYATFYARGGAENIILWMTEELLRRGHSVTIFTSEQGVQDSDLPEEIRQCFVELYAGGNYSTWIDWLVAGWRLRKRLQEFDVVNPHNFPANVWVYFAKCFSPTFPPVLWFCQEPPASLYHAKASPQSGRYQSLRAHVQAKFRHEGLKTVRKMWQKLWFYSLNKLFPRPLRRFHIWLDQHAARSCDRVLANSEYSATRIRQIYLGAVFPCYLGIPVQHIPQIQARSKKRYFLTVSRLEPPKHIDTIIRAVKLVVQKRGERSLSLKVFGTGSQEKYLQELACELGVQDHVFFEGFVPDNEVFQAYSGAFAVIYIPEDEPFGLVPLEAMASGAPVIVSDSGGPAESVIHQHTGRHVNPHSTEQLADAMLTLMADPKRADEMGQQGYRHVMAQFTISRFVDRFEAHLNAIGEKSDPGRETLL